MSRINLIRLFVLTLTISGFAASDCAAQSVGEAKPVKKIPVGLRQAYSSAKTQVLDAERRIAKTDEKIKNLERNLEEAKVLAKESRSVLKKAEITANALTDLVPELAKQRVHLSIDLAGLAARKQVVARLAARKVDPRMDEVVRNYEKLVVIRKKQRDQVRARVAAAAVPASAMDEATVKLLDAEIQLQKVIHDRKSNESKVYEMMLREISLEEAEKIARKTVIEGMLKKFLNASDAAKVLSNAERSVHSLQTDLQTKRDMKEDLMSLLRNRMDQLSHLKSEIDQYQSKK